MLSTSVFRCSVFGGSAMMKGSKGVGTTLFMLLVSVISAVAPPAVAQEKGAQEKPMPRKMVRIALVSDSHTTRGTAEDQPLYKGHLDQVIADVNKTGVDVVLIAGDLTQGGKPEEREDFKAQIKGFTAPVLFVPGNHDVGGKHEAGKPGGVTAKREETFEQAFGPSFWTNTRYGIRLIGINSPILGSGLPRETEQWAFLEKELAHPSELPTLLVTHYPLYTKTPDEPGGVYWNIEPEPRKRLRTLLQQAHVKAVLSGHLHYPLILHDEDRIYISTEPVSFGLPRGKQTQGWTLVTIAPDGTVTPEPHNIIPPVPAIH